MKDNEFKNKKALVIGLGRSGVAASRALLELGADVTVQDSLTEDEISKELLIFWKAKKSNIIWAAIQRILRHSMS